MDVSTYIQRVASEGEQFASVAAQGDLDADIAACPGWDLRELVRHLGLIHLWAAANVAFPKDAWLAVDDLSDLAGHWPELAASWPDDIDLVAWYRSCHTNLVRVLEAAPADHMCFTFLPAASPVSMWARRQASEIAIHRFDAERSQGVASRYDPQFAADMLDELLSGFAPRPRPIAVDGPHAILAHAHDVDEHWHVTIGPQGIETSRDADHAELTVTGSAADLYLVFWNRTADESVTLAGDTDLMDLWRTTCRIRWS